MDVGVLEVILIGSASLLSVIGTIMTAQMRSTAVQNKARDKSKAEQAKAAQVSQQAMIDSILGFATEMRKGTDTFKAFPPNGNHVLTHKLLERQESVLDRHTDVLVKIDAGQDKWIETLEDLTRTLGHVRICSCNDPVSESTRGHAL